MAKQKSENESPPCTARSRCYAVPCSPCWYGRFPCHPPTSPETCESCRELLTARGDWPSRTRDARCKHPLWIPLLPKQLGDTPAHWENDALINPKLLNTSSSRLF